MSKSEQDTNHFKVYYSTDEVSKLLHINRTIVYTWLDAVFPTVHQMRGKRRSSRIKIPKSLVDGLKVIRYLRLFYTIGEIKQLYFKLSDHEREQCLYQINFILNNKVV